MISDWLYKAKKKAKLQRIREQMWNSPLAAELFEEVMKSSPTYISIQTHQIGWGNKLTYYPSHRIYYPSRGYRKLVHDGEVEALREYFIKKSSNKYREIHTENSSLEWGCDILTCAPPDDKPLNEWW